MEGDGKVNSKLKMQKIVLPVLSILSLAMFLPGYQAVWAWGPERETFTMEKPAPRPTFNSITNNPVLGDERNFVRVAEVGASGTFEDEIQIVPGKEYEVYVGYHNNAAGNLNSTGVGIANNVRLSSQFPSVVTPEQKGKVSAIISSTNTTPPEVWDEAYFTATQEVQLHYKEGSAKIYNSWGTNGRILSESMFGVSGTFLGVDELDGWMPGCAEFSGRVVYVLVAEAPALKIEKTVSLDGENFSENVIAEAGHEITYRVTFENTGNTDLTNVTFADKFPAGVSLVDNTTYLHDEILYPNGELLSNLIDKNGYNLGMFGPGSKATLTYKAKIADDAVVNGNCGANKLVNTMYVKHDDGEGSDGATVTVNKVCTPTELPETGPGEIVLAVVAVLAVGVGGTYWYRSRKMLKKVSDDVDGGDDKTGA